MIFIKNLFKKKFSNQKKNFIQKKISNQKKFISFRFNRFRLKISKGKLSWNIEVWLLWNCHRKFLVSCKYCRETFCKACHNFNIAKETLLKGLDPIGKEYIENFIKDFLCISSETLQTNYQVSEIVRVPIEKTFNVKSYHKSNKNRSQVVYKKFDNCEKLSYTVKGKPRTFYKKF